MTTTAVTSPLAFVNHALALIGAEPLTDLLAESGATNALADQIYDRVIDTMLAAYPWAFATRRIELSELADSPPDPWVYQYELPANTLRILGTDTEGQQYRIYSEGGSEGVGARRMYTMTSGTWADVVIRPTDELFPAHFSAAIIPELAAQFAPSVTGDLSIAQYFRAEASAALSRAKMHDASENPSPSWAGGNFDPRTGSSARRYDSWEQ